jgi:hypothetical protein
MAVLWVAAPYSLVEVSEVLSASIIRAMIMDGPDDGGSNHL